VDFEDKFGGWIGASSTEAFLNHTRVLSKVDHSGDDNARTFDAVKNPVGEAANEKSAVRLAKYRGKFWKTSQISKRSVQMSHEHFTKTLLPIFTTIIRSLDVCICRE
jgi:hypothetical protein